MLEILIITIIMVSACVVLLSTGILLKKDGKFPDTHIDGNKHLREKGIRCAASQDYEAGRRAVPEELLK